MLLHYSTTTIIAQSSEFYYICGWFERPNSCIQSFKPNETCKTLKTHQTNLIIYQVQIYIIIDTRIHQYRRQLIFS